MSNSYSASQYDDVFSPKRLNMYQVPKNNVSKLPSSNLKKGETKIISNDKGHLLDGVQRSNGNPFGDYVGTWDMPKKIEGPYHLVKTGRTEKNIKNLHEKKLNIDREIAEARENQKPLNLRRSTE